MALGLVTAQDGSNVPTPCNPQNPGRCECGDVSRGFQTYTFTSGGEQRCFTVYHPVELASQPLPAYLFSQCYAADELQGLEMTNENSPSNAAAGRYGFARIGLSTPDGNWQFGNDGVVNDEYPQPCSNADSKDNAYLRTVFDFIDNNPDQFDGSRIYAEGFSQNSMFSAHIGHCFQDRVTGIWQGGSGMSLTGQRPYTPGCEGQVEHSVWEQCGGNCDQCIQQNGFCSDCKYWPIYPCYSPAKPMVVCLHEYTNDGISVDQVNPDVNSTALYMNAALKAEGHDARLLRFSPSPDNSIEGGHRDPNNGAYWHVGCLGITAPCSLQCEAAFLECIETRGPFNTALDRARAFDECMRLPGFAALPGCADDCAPTYDMLAAGEEPTTAEFDNFGAGQENAGPRPGSSVCITE